MIKATVRFRLDFGDSVSIGPGKMDLLENIRSSGSLSQAGRELGMSYRRAWLLLDNLNTSFREPVVTTSIGGKAGGGAALTAFGEQLVQCYRELQAEFNIIAVKKLKGVSGTQTVVAKRGIGMRMPLVKSPSPRRVRKRAR